MSLSRQLIIIITLLFIVLFIGTLAVSTHNTRGYLAHQLESHAQDTASSLGLSLTPHMANNDLPTMTSMVDAIFDRGYYRDIRIIAIDGTPIIERVLNVTVKDVPAWFVDMLPLETPEGLSTITHNWKQVARVQVRSHPGYAYLDLWRNTVDTFWWFLFSFAVGVVTFVMVLRVILKPLSQVENQALAISRREFPIMHKLPWTRELRRVVIAMNRMSFKVKGMLSEQTDMIERIRKEVYVDPLTGLANRRSFDMQLEHLVKAADDIHQGAVLFIGLKDLAEVNTTRGYQQGDELLKETADAIRRCTAPLGQVFVARISGGEFGVLLPGAHIETVNELAKELAYQIPLIEEQFTEQGTCHIGGAWYSGKIQGDCLLAKADMALRASLQQGPNAWQVYGMDEQAATVVHGAQSWAKILQNSIDLHKYVFSRQPVINIADGHRLHYEVYTRLMGDDGELISAAVFMPTAERLGLMPKLDRYILENLLCKLATNDENGTGSYSINLSPSSVHDPAFMDWAYARLAAVPALAGRIILETPEYAAIADTQAFKAIVSRFHGLGCRVSLDHFGTAFAPFGYLHDLKLDFIKIHGGLVRGVSENKDNRFFIQSLCQIAHGLDVQVLGEFVENEADWQQLRELGLDGAQGYHFGQPEAW